MQPSAHSRTDEPATVAGLHETASDTAEAALLGRVAQGDKSALKTLFASYGERVFRYAYRLVGDSGKAEEVTNDVLLEVWRSAARFEGRSKPSTWILGIARNLALNSIRRRSLDTVDIDAVPEPIDMDASADVAAQAQDAQLLKRALQSALRQLSTEHRDVVELTFFQGCSYPEIAQIVGCPENTVKTRMFHAKKQLKRLLAQQDLEWGASFAAYSQHEGWS